MPKPPLKGVSSSIPISQRDVVKELDGDHSVLSVPDGDSQDRLHQVPATVRGVPKNRFVLIRFRRSSLIVPKVVWQLGTSPDFRLASLIAGDSR